MAQDVTARLEAVCARLESIANRLDDGEDSGEGPPQYVIDYNNLVQKKVKSVIDMMKSEAFLKLFPRGGKCADELWTAHTHCLNVVKNAPSCKKPAVTDWNQWIVPLSDADTKVNKLSAPKSRKKKDWDEAKSLEGFYKAIQAAIKLCHWVYQDLPAKHTETEKQSCAFNIYSLQKQDKFKNDATFKKWVEAISSMHADIVKFVSVKKLKTGLPWNPKGTGSITGKAADIPCDDGEKGGGEEKKSDQSGGGKKKSGGGGGGMAAVFGQLNKGLNVTKGMKKVTKDMKTKNRKDKVSKVTMTNKPKGKKRKKFGPPKSALQGSRYIVENYDTGLVVVDKCTIKQSVFITTCDNMTVQVKNKVKSIAIDNCVKCRVYMEEVLSTIEVVNCKSLYLNVAKQANSITVDKCESATVCLQKTAFDKKPEIYTSNVTAMNIEIPDKNNADDTRELPVPEQFVIRIDPQTHKMTCNTTEH